MSNRLDVEAVAQVVAEKTEALRAALADAGKGEKMGEAAVVDKDRAQEVYDLVLTWGARILQSYFILAGERKLAARIRPLTVRPARDGGPSDDGPVDKGSEPGDPGEDPDAVEPGENGPSEGQPAEEPAPGG